MTVVKICGIRRKDDILYVNKYKPSYIGFVFAQSKRRVSKEEARDLASLLSPHIKTVGVFVNEDLNKVLNIALFSGLDCLQLHGEESPSYVEELNGLLSESLENKREVEIWKAFRVKDQDFIKELKNYKANSFLLDAFVEGSYGGAGKTFDWELALEAKKYGKIFIAGGININNVKDAIEKVRPFGIDVSSGVETEGVKDSNKIKDFIKAVEVLK